MVKFKRIEITLHGESTKSSIRFEYEDGSYIHPLYHAGDFITFPLYMGRHTSYDILHMLLSITDEQLEPLVKRAIIDSNARSILQALYNVRKTGRLPEWIE